MTAQLHCFGESGHSYKVALMMQLVGYPWQPVFVDFFNGGTRGSDYRALNEMAEAPVFIEDDLTLTQSGVILLHLAEKTGRFVEGDRNEILRWLFWDNHKLSTAIGTTRFLMNFLPPEKRPEAVIPFMQGRLKAAYTVLNDHLDGRNWIAGDAVTIADRKAGEVTVPRDQIHSAQLVLTDALIAATRPLDTSGADEIIEIEEEKADD